MIEYDKYSLDEEHKKFFNLKIKTFEDTDLHYSQRNSYLNNEENAENYLSDIYAEVLEEDKINTVLRKYLGSIDNKNIGVLKIKTRHLKDWGFTSKNKFHKVEDWVRVYDGKYGILIIDAENPASREIQTLESALIIHSNIDKKVKEKYGITTTEIYIPKIGRVDNYTLEKADILIGIGPQKN